MKSQKQKDQAFGYVRGAIIRTILRHYKAKLEDLSMEELEEELYAEEQTTKFGEIPFAVGEKRLSDEKIKALAEDIITQARKAGYTITPKEERIEVKE
jgi:cytochrome c553